MENNNFKIQDSSKKKNRTFNTVLIVQFVICGLLLLLIYVSANSNSDKLSAFAFEYSTGMEKELTSDDLEKANDKISAFSKSIIQNKKIDKTAVGGVDINISQKDLNEGIFLGKYTLPFKIMCPVEDYFISSPFGQRENPLTGEDSIHIGLDFASAYGSDIHSAYSGTVRKTDFSQGYGNYIVVTHTDGIETLYAHCSSVSAKAGDKVDKGDVIAKVGSTGNSTGNHLHFEIRFRNVKINPAYALDL